MQSLARMIEQAVEQIVEAAYGAAEDVPTRAALADAIDLRAITNLAALTHQALTHRRPAEREALLDAWAAGDTIFGGCLSPRGRPALVSVIAGRPIVVAELEELGVHLDDVL